MLIASALAAAAATGTPTHLQCKFPTAPVEVLVAADEPNGAVTVSIPSTGYSERLSGAFGADRLSFDNDMMSISIARTTMWTLRGQRDGKVAEGKCTIEEPPKRAF